MACASTSLGARKNERPPRPYPLSRAGFTCLNFHRVLSLGAGSPAFATGKNIPGKHDSGNKDRKKKNDGGTGTPFRSQPGPPSFPANRRLFLNIRVLHRWNYTSQNSIPRTPASLG